MNSGGHGFKVIETVEMIEVKQGPYNLNSDKKVFNNIEDNVVKIKWYQLINLSYLLLIEIL